MGTVRVHVRAWREAGDVVAGVRAPHVGAPGNRHVPSRAPSVLVSRWCRSTYTRWNRSGKPVTDLALEDFGISSKTAFGSGYAHFSTQAFTPSGPVERRVALEPVAATGAGSPSTKSVDVTQTSRVYLIVLGRGRLQVAKQGVDGVLHFVRIACCLRKGRNPGLQPCHRLHRRSRSLVPVLERYRKAHEDIEVGSPCISAASRASIALGMSDFLQTGDRSASSTGPANTRTMPLESVRDGSHGRRLPEAGDRRPDRQSVGEPVGETEAAIEGHVLRCVRRDERQGRSRVSNIQAGIDYLRHIEGEKHLVYIAYGGFKTSGSSAALEGVARAAGPRSSSPRYRPHRRHRILAGRSPRNLRTIAETKLGIGYRPPRARISMAGRDRSAQTSRKSPAETGGTFDASRYRTVADDLTAIDLSAGFRSLLGYYPSRTTTDRSVPED